MLAATLKFLRDPAFVISLSGRTKKTYNSENVAPPFSLEGRWAVSTAIFNTLLPLGSQTGTKQGNVGKMAVLQLPQCVPYLRLSLR